MTIISGIINFNKNINVKKDEKTQIIDSISRNKELEYSNFDENNYFISTVNSQKNYFSKFYKKDNKSLTIIIGNPYLNNCIINNDLNYLKQLDQIHCLCIENNWDILKNNARGVFAIVHINKSSNKLFLISDKLGIFPIYYHYSNEKLYFSSALRILEGNNSINKKINIPSIAEISAFGFPLSKRTPYKNIKRIAHSEIITFESGKEIANKYWNWDSIKEISSHNYNETVIMAYENFSKAIKIRLNKDSISYAFLSGGLDSRCIVSELKKCNQQVHAFNFSHKNSQDWDYANELSKKLNLKFYSSPLRSDANWSQMMANTLNTIIPNNTDSSSKIHTVWSGDGGSVSVGLVYLNKEIIKSAEANDLNTAINLFMLYNNIHFPQKILSKQYNKNYKEYLFNQIKNETHKFPNTNTAKALHFFLMTNDQRRHLDNHFENADLHNLEFHLPFFDSFFLETIFSIPTNRCINHNFYNDWFKLFLPESRSIPWQTYPGHVSCPIKTSKKLSYQWSNNDKKCYLKNITESKNALTRAYFNKFFTSKLFNKKTLLLAILLHGLMIRNYNYLFNTILKFIQYLKREQNK